MMLRASALLRANRMFINFRFALEKKKKDGIEDEFSQLFTQKKKDKKQTSGRAWHPEELRLKSNEDLHKLWFVCVKEKNLLLADKILEERMSQNVDKLNYRVDKVKKTMRRILGVINERQQIRQQYREQLQNQYIQKKKEELQSKLNSQEDQLPEITQEMLRAKYHALRRGVDNVKYLEKIWNKKEEFQGKKARMNERANNFNLKDFKSFWEYEMGIGERPMQEEILRAHITNWKSLNFKQRRIVLGFLNARRSNDAKKQFLKQVRILGQRIAQDQAKNRIENSNE